MRVESTMAGPILHAVGREVGILRDVAGDVVTVVGFGPGSREPTYSANMGGFFGERGSLPKTVVKAGIDTVDNGFQLVQEVNEGVRAFGRSLLRGY